MALNAIVLFVAALVPLVVGYIWYSQSTLGKYLMTPETEYRHTSISWRTLSRICLTYLFGLLIAYTLMGLVIHQFGMMQVLIGLPGFEESGSEPQKYFEDFIANYGNHHRNWKHGMLHGVIASITFSLPVIGIGALFTNKGWTYVGVHVGYWLVTLTIMGGLISHFL